MVGFVLGDVLLEIFDSEGGDISEEVGDRLALGLVFVLEEAFPEDDLPLDNAIAG